MKKLKWKIESPTPNPRIPYFHHSNWFKRVYQRFYFERLARKLGVATPPIYFNFWHKIRIWFS